MAAISKIQLNSDVFDVKDAAARNAITALPYVIYPVGSVYFSTVNTNPYELFGFGTWTQINITATWDQLNSGGQSYVDGETNGNLYVWRRNA